MPELARALALGVLIGATLAVLLPKLKLPSLPKLPSPAPTPDTPPAPVLLLDALAGRPLRSTLLQALLQRLSQPKGRGRPRTRSRRRWWRC